MIVSIYELEHDYDTKAMFLSWYNESGTLQSFWLIDQGRFKQVGQSGSPKNLGVDQVHLLN